MTRSKGCLALAAVLALAFTAGPAAAEDDEQPRTTRIIDVADLEPIRNAKLRRVIWGKLMFRVRCSNESWEEVLTDADDQGAGQHFSADSFAESLYSIGAESDDDFDIEVQGTQIVLRGSPEAVQRALDAAEILRRTAGTPARVDVHDLVLPPDVQVPAVLDDAALAALRRHDLRGGARRLSLDLDFGSWRLAEAVTGARRVVDADVEIAEDAAIADPIVSRVEEGVRVMARAAPLTDGRMVMRVIAATSDLVDRPRRLALGQDELGEIDLPDLDAGFISTELILTAGKAQTVVLARPENEQRVLIFRLQSVPTERIGGTFRAVPFGAFPEGDMLLNLRMSDDPMNDEGMSLWLDESDEMRRLTRDFASNEIERVMQPDFDEDLARGDHNQWLLGGSYLLFGPEASLDRAFERMAEIERDVFRPARLTIRFEHRSPEGGEAHAIGSLSAPVAIGIPSAIAAYRHLAFVVDYDVEVAQKAQIADPRVGAALAGILANVTVADAGHGAHVVRAELRLSTFDTPRGRGFGATDVGALETVHEVSRYAEARVRTTAARPGEVHMGSSPFDEGAQLVAVITVE
jgi:hypothetical protein